MATSSKQRGLLQEKSGLEVFFLAQSFVSSFSGKIKELDAGCKTELRILEEKTLTKELLKQLVSKEDTKKLEVSFPEMIKFLKSPREGSRYLFLIRGSNGALCAVSAIHFKATRLDALGWSFSSKRLEDLCPKSFLGYCLVH